MTAVMPNAFLTINLSPAQIPGDRTAAVPCFGPQAAAAPFESSPAQEDIREAPGAVAEPEVPGATDCIGEIFAHARRLVREEHAEFDRQNRLRALYDELDPPNPPLPIFLTSPRRPDITEVDTDDNFLKAMLKIYFRMDA